MECAGCWPYTMSPCVEARRARPLLGTFVELTVRAPNDTVLQRALGVGFIAILEVQRLMNRHDPLSEISLLQREAVRRNVRVHRWTRAVLAAAEEFSRASEGAFDITGRSDGSWRDIVLEEGGVRFRRPLALDLGGIAKGFAVDRAVEAMRKAGAPAGTVNAGGDLRVFGEAAEMVQIRHPLAPGCAAGAVRLRERALATSARYFAPALFDGRSGRPLAGEVSVTVGAADCVTADALTKITLVLREEARSLLDRFGADAFLLERNLPPRWFNRHDASQLHST